MRYFVESILTTMKELLPCQKFHLMIKRQTDRLTTQHQESQGPKGIFGKDAQLHDLSVNDVSKLTLKTLEEEFPQLEFRYREQIKKAEINQKLNSVDERLGQTLYVAESKIKPDGGVIEVKDNNGNWRIVLVSEAKHQGKDLVNIAAGILVGKNKDQELMVAGNAIERSHKNINEIRNFMIDEKHFPYVLFLTGSNFMTESTIVKRPDGTEIELKHDVGSLNRIDRLTSANYSLPINQNSCENIVIDINGQKVMLQAVSIYTRAVQWDAEEMLQILIDVSTTSLRILGLLPDKT